MQVQHAVTNIFVITFFAIISIRETEGVLEITLMKKTSEKFTFTTGIISCTFLMIA
jgi:hypothetical protein